MNGRLFQSLLIKIGASTSTKAEAVLPQLIIANFVDLEVTKNNIAQGHFLMNSNLLKAIGYFKDYGGSCQLNTSLFN